MDVHEFLELKDDYLVNLYFNEYKQAIKDGDINRESYYKTKLSNRIKDIEQSYSISKADYLIESIAMWNEIVRQGYNDKEYLLPEHFPLSLDQDNYVSCALCNYARLKSRKKAICQECPVKWSTGTCHDLYNQWSDADTPEDSKKYATLIVNEIKKGL